ncbi:sorting nexin-11-like isoform X2 [Littorina saxatilis]|uniref:sorting nexin-11-like isoform X2 n=1 Tax=Littorina saxatilis TaxID=31220 RepID=UPI0038B656AB
MMGIVNLRVHFSDDERTCKERRPAHKRAGCTLKIVLPETSYSSFGSYTTYCIYLQSYSSAFRLHRTETRRRFSDFVWLRKELDKIDNWRSPPPLSARRFWNLLDPEFVEERRQQLETWTREVLMDPAYLSHAGLHMFVQTQMSVEQIQDYLHGKVSEERIEEIWSYRGHLDAYGAQTCLLNSLHYEPIVISFSPDEENVDPCRSPPIKGLDTLLDIHTPPGQLSVPESSQRSIAPCGAGPDSTACDQHWTSTPDSGFQGAGQESSGSSASSAETTTTTASTTEAVKSPESGKSSAETTTTIKSVRYQSQASTEQKYSINGD